MYLRIRKNGEMREIRILHALPGDWEAAMALAWRTFRRFEADQYPREGSESFLKFISDGLLNRMFLLGRYRLWVAKDADVIVGLISLREHNHISLLFVDEKYQRCGIGRALIATVSEYLKDEPDERYLPENEEEKILDLLYEKEPGGYCTVFAAPNATEFYHNLGFRDTAGMQENDGIIFTPMRLEGRA